MSSEYEAKNNPIITELNKQRDLQKELIARKEMLKHWADITSKDYDDVVFRLQEVSEKIQTLREKL